MLDSEWQDLLEKFREADEKYHTASFWLRAVPCPEPTPELLSLSPDYRNVVVADTGQLAVPIGVVELTCPTRILAVRPMPHFQADSSGVLFRLTEASNSNCCRPMSFSDADSLDKKSNGLKSGRGDKTGASWHMFWSLMDAMPAQDASALIDALPGPVHLGGTKLNGLLPAWHRAVKAFFELARLGGDLLSKRDLESMWVSEEPEPETLWAQFLGNALSSLEIPGSPPSQVLMMASNAVEVTRPFFSSIETIKEQQGALRAGSAGACLDLMSEMSTRPNRAFWVPGGRSLRLWKEKSTRRRGPWTPSELHDHVVCRQELLEDCQEDCQEDHGVDYRLKAARAFYSEAHQKALDIYAADPSCPTPPEFVSDPELGLINLRRWCITAKNTSRSDSAVEEESAVPFVELDWVSHHLTVGPSKFLLTGRPWELLAALAAYRDQGLPRVQHTPDRDINWKNAVDQLRRKLSKDHLRVVILFSRAGYHLAPDVRVVGKGQVAIRRTGLGKAKARRSRNRK